MDFARFNSFKKYQGGPTDYCSWLIHGAYARVMFGAYPCGQARIKADKITSRSSSAAQLLVDGVDTFVCLMESSELERRAAEHPKGWTYDVEVDTTCADIRSELITGVNSAKDAMMFAAKRAARGREVGYGKVQQEALERAQESRTYDYEKAKAFYDNFAERLQHVRVPVPKDGTIDDVEVVELCQDIERRLRRGERVYVFSDDGHGRVGVVATVLLARLYGLATEDAIERAKLYHQAQGRFAVQQEKRATFALPTFPQCPAQRAQIVRVLAKTDPSYDGIRRRGGMEGVEAKPIDALSDAQLWEERLQKRSVGVPRILNAHVRKFRNAHLPPIPRLDLKSVKK